MTRNQIAYSQMLLDSAYKTKELSEKRRSNLAQERISSQAHLETVRSNFAKEQETKRSNLAKETETHRSNTAVERETSRSNQAREFETNRSNVAKETTELLKHQENVRHNSAVETEAHRSNLASELLTEQRNQETERSNRAGEALGYANVGVASMNAQTNAGQLAYAYANLDESKRHNKVSEDTNRLSVGADVYDAQTRRLQAVDNRTFNQEKLKQGKATLDETIRSNVEREKIMREQNIAQTTSSLVNTLGRVVSGVFSSRQKGIKIK